MLISSAACAAGIAASMSAADRRGGSEVPCVLAKLLDVERISPGPSESDSMASSVIDTQLTCRLDERHGRVRRKIRDTGKVNNRSAYERASPVSLGLRQASTDERDRHVFLRRPV